MLSEIWKDVSGYEGLYRVSTFGNVFSYISHKVLKPCNRSGGHVVVNLYKDHKMKSQFIHRLVAEAFIPNPDNLPVIHHKDDNPKNNHVSNLMWCTQKENVHFTIATGKHGKMWGRK